MLLFVCCSNWNVSHSVVTGGSLSLLTLMVATSSGRPTNQTSQGNPPRRHTVISAAQQTVCTEIVYCFHGPSGVLFIQSDLVEHSSSSATALITDTRTVQVFAQGIIVCVTVTARALVTVLCYLCVLKCLVYYYYFFCSRE